MTDDSKQYPLISFLEKHAEDRAMLAELRRGLGKAPGEAPGMYPFVIPFIHDEREEPNIYLVAALFALHPMSARSGNMGDHLRAHAAAAGNDDATARRFVQLLRQRRASLDTPLRQHINLLKSKDVAVNWHQLMHDLGAWSHHSHFVQKNWARTYWKSEKSQTS